MLKQQQLQPSAANLGHNTNRLHDDVRELPLIFKTV